MDFKITAAESPGGLAASPSAGENGAASSIAGSAFAVFGGLAISILSTLFWVFSSLVAVHLSLAILLNTVTMRSCMSGSKIKCGIYWIYFIKKKFINPLLITDL